MDRMVVLFVLLHLCHVSFGEGPPGIPNPPAPANISANRKDTVNDHRFDFGVTFNKIGDGIFEDWKKITPADVEGQFALRYVPLPDDNLFAISKRSVQLNGSAYPELTSAQGGIVSIFPIAIKKWAHTKYDVLDAGANRDVVFALGPRLFLLSYQNSGKFEFRKLFYWSPEKSIWQEVPLQADPEASPKGTKSINTLHVNVPSIGSTVAYVAVSNFDGTGHGSEHTFSKLEVEFQGKDPTKASLKPITRIQETASYEVAFSGLSGKNNLLVLVLQITSDGAFAKTDFAYLIDLTTNAVSNTTLVGTPPPQNTFSDRIYQSDDFAYIFGGFQSVGLGKIEPVHKIWTLDLVEYKWRSANNQLEPTADEAVVVAPKTIYEVSLKNGVYDAMLPN